jgi:hypothetical protein
MEAFEAKVNSVLNKARDDAGACAAPQAGCAGRTRLGMAGLCQSGPVLAAVPAVFEC